MIIFSANVTVSGTITFLGDATHSGTINGAAVFNDSSRSTGTITGNVTFNDNSKNDEDGVVNGAVTLNDCGNNAGTVSGAITNNRVAGCPPGSGQFQTFNPPLLGSWYTSGNKRLLRILGSRNRDALIAAFGRSLTIDGGPWQTCPPEGCHAYPALYRPSAYVSFVMDYEDQPEYLNFPGNPES